MKHVLFIGEFDVAGHGPSTVHVEVNDARLERALYRALRTKRLRASTWAGAVTLVVEPDAARVERRRREQST